MELKPKLNSRGFHVCPQSHFLFQGDKITMKGKIIYDDTVLVLIEPHEILYDGLTWSIKQPWKQRILDLYLQCWTQQQIADELSMPQQTIADVIKKITENGEIAKIGNDFKTQLYKKWKYAHFTTSIYIL